mgnify:CR=1 FL=1
MVLVFVTLVKDVIPVIEANDVQPENMLRVSVALLKAAVSIEVNDVQSQNIRPELITLVKAIISIEANDVQS